MRGATGNFFLIRPENNANLTRELAVGQATEVDEETRSRVAGEAGYGGWKELDEGAPMRPEARGKVKVNPEEGDSE